MKSSFDIWSGLANFLTEMIEKYSDDLEIVFESEGIIPKENIRRLIEKYIRAKYVTRKIIVDIYIVNG